MVGEHVIMSRTTDETGAVQPTREQVAEALGVAYTPKFRPPGTEQHHYAVEDRQRRERDEWDSLKFVPILLLLASPALAQTYGVGRAPTAAELAQDITISPDGSGTSSRPRHRRGRRKLFIDKELHRLSRPRRRGRVDGGAQSAGEKRPGS